MKKFLIGLGITILSVTANADQISDKLKKCEFSSRLIGEAALARDKGISKEYALDYALSRMYFIKLSDQQLAIARSHFDSIANILYADLKEFSPYEISSLIMNTCLSKD